MSPGHAGLHISVSLGEIVNRDVFIITSSPSGWVGDMRLEWKSFKVLVEIESRGVLSKLYSFFKCAVLGRVFSLPEKSL